MFVYKVLYSRLLLSIDQLIYQYHYQVLLSTIDNPNYWTNVKILQNDNLIIIVIVVNNFYNSLDTSIVEMEDISIKSFMVSVL